MTHERRKFPRVILETNDFISEIQALKKENDTYLEDRDRWIAKAINLEEDFRVMREIAIGNYHREMGVIELNTISKAIKEIDREFERRRKK